MTTRNRWRLTAHLRPSSACRLDEIDRRLRLRIKETRLCRGRRLKPLGLLCGLEPSISEDGRYVAFASFSDDLVPGDTNGVGDASCEITPPVRRPG